MSLADRLNKTQEEKASYMQVSEIFVVTPSAPFLVKRSSEAASDG
jgi:hypothetical protein